MRATLLHNRRSGTDQGAHPKRRMIGLLRDAGYKVDYWATHKQGWEKGLEDPGDLLVVAGGDGTVSKVLRRLERRDVPLAILPLGGSNNVATALGIKGSPERIVAGLGEAKRRRLDLGMARSAMGERPFVESAGLGLFTDFLKQSDPGNGGASGVERLLQLTTRVKPRRYRIKADGRDLTGSYVLVMALNLPQIGPRLELGPGAEPGDGKLDLLLVGASQSRALKEYLRGLASGAAPAFPFTLERVQRVRMGWVVGAGHLDDRVWPKGGPARQGVMTLEVAAAPFEVLAV